MRDRTLFLGAAALGLATLPACFLFETEPKANILLIVVDSLRSDALSQSSGAPDTPNMRALARDGVALQGCFSHSPVSLPALTALLSSRTPHENRVMNDGQDIDPSIALGQEWLQKQGYETFASFSLDAFHPGQSSKGLDRGFHELQTWPRESVEAELVVQGFQSFLDRAPTDRPWFALLQLSEPHEPYAAHGGVQVPATILRDGKELETLSVAEGCLWRCQAILAPGKTRFCVRSDVPLRVRRFGASSKQGEIHALFERGTPDEAAREFVIAFENPGTEALACDVEGWIHDAPGQAESRRRYRMEVEAVDRAVGEILGRLRAKGLYDDALVVLTSDHGEALGEHGHVGHADNLYDELLRVPLLVKPALEDRQRRTLLAQGRHELSRHIDVLPTVLELAHVRPLPGGTGTSLLVPMHRELVAETHAPDAPNTLFAIRDGRHKLVLGAGNAPFEMYDLQSDTLEVENLFPLQGQFKLEWQARLRELVASSPQTMQTRMGRVSLGEAARR